MSEIPRRNHGEVFVDGVVEGLFDLGKNLEKILTTVKFDNQMNAMKNFYLFVDGVQ